MKPLKTKTYLIQTALLVMAVTFAVIGLVLSLKTVPFFPSVEAITAGEQTHIEIKQGLIPLSHLSLFIGFLCVYLIFEFYGFKAAFYSSLSLSFSLVASNFIFTLVCRYLLDPELSHVDQLLSEVLVFPFRATLALACAVAGGFSVVFVFAAAIKKLTRNYLMFIRFPIAAIIGFGVFTGIKVFISQFNTAALPTMFFDGITPFSHFVSLTLVSLVPLYLLRLLLVLFRGSNKDHDLSEPQTTSQGVFVSPSEDAEDNETTVSRKIRFGFDPSPSP